MNKALTLIFIFIASIAIAQQDPYYTHFKDIPQAFNPAAAGHDTGEVCFSGLTHHQWRDFEDHTKIRGSEGDLSLIAEDVAPVTYNLNVGSMWTLDKAKTKFLGTGLTIVDDKIGYTKGTTVMANINYKMDFQGGFSQLSIGAGVGVTQWGYDKPQFKFRQANDPNIPTAGQKDGQLDVNFGVFYKMNNFSIFKDFYAGLSVTNLNGATYNVPTNTGTIDIDFVPHYYALAGGDYDLGNGIVLEPAVLAKYALIGGEFRPQFDLNVTALYAQSLRGGAAYRQWGNADAVSLLIGYIPKDNLEIGYSYDVTLSNIQKVSNGTHEIMVKYCIPIVTRPPTPPIIRLTPRFL